MLLLSGDVSNEGHIGEESIIVYYLSQYVTIVQYGCKRKIDMVELNMEQPCCRVRTSILHRVEVMLVNNKFNFNELIQFGLFIVALLTFVYLICH